LVGPVGVDLDMITDVLSTALKLYNYNADPLRVTGLMRVIPSDIKIDDSDYLKRIMTRIDYADDACKRIGRADALAAVVPSRLIQSD
jgi:hypothetical protein